MIAIVMINIYQKSKFIILIIMITLLMNSCLTNKKQKKLNYKDQNEKFVNRKSVINMEDWIFSFDSIKDLNKSLNKSFKCSLITDSIVLKENIQFYKFNSDNYKDHKLYLGVRNDTIFSYDLNLDFIDVFLILNENKKQYLSRIGSDYRCTLISFDKTEEDELYTFRIDTIISNYSDAINTLSYPDMIFKEFYVSTKTGFLNIKILDKKSKIVYSPASARL